MFLSSRRQLARCVLACAMVLSASAHGQSAPAAADSEFEQARDAALAHQQAGPRDISLGDQARIALPAGYAFIPKAEASRLMQAMGNRVGDGFYGLIIGDRLDGFVSVRFDSAGYIKDDDARDWDADALLKNLKEGTEEANKDRHARGMPEFVVEGWVEKPAYDAATHRLVWSASTHDKDAASGRAQGVNYNTYLLGRDGYLSLNLVTELATVEKEKPAARELLAAASFIDGKRYADFNASTDKVAEYGLAALVGGIAAKKLGLLAMAGVFLAKAWKLIAVAVIALGAGAKKIFGDRDKA
ncbi:DUF2167 domain-containing protein [Uliginosibacterium sp. sgz301328]|uniref:DUF2167 domain-containing protein n=1 Tax=Uliginosibacterium sp. sgz301328 TaxID=3243764 RepID=UPI00359E3027